jgi:hypothetical protein
MIEHDVWLVALDGAHRGLIGDAGDSSGKKWRQGAVLLDVSDEWARSRDIVLDGVELHVGTDRALSTASLWLPASERKWLRYCKDFRLDRCREMGHEWSAASSMTTWTRTSFA